MKAKDWPFERVIIECETCPRHGDYSKERFVEIVGEDTDLPVALKKVAESCPEEKKSTENMHAKCRPYYAQDWWNAG